MQIQETNGGNGNARLLKMRQFTTNIASH
jgi:hypothetical protein